MGLQLLDFKFDKDLINNFINDNIKTDSPIVYIIHNNKVVYIGESANVKSRMKDHLKNDIRTKLTDVTVIESEEFNKSATFNIETNLINYFLADEKYELQNAKQIKQKVTHNYYQKDYYNTTLFEQLWKRLKESELVDNDLVALRNKDIFKLSPFKELSEEQFDLKNEIINTIKSTIDKKEKTIYVVNGDAGTGKSVLISSIYNEIQSNISENSSSLYKTNNYLLVNHGEVLRSYSKLAQNIKYITQNKILKPTSFINKIESADVVIIDEAHLLLSRSDSYNNYNGNNQITDIINKSKVIILMVDFKQYLKVKSYWSESNFYNSIPNVKHKLFKYNLTEQFRMNIDKQNLLWIDNFVNKKITNIPKQTEKFELKIFDDCSKMYEEIRLKNNKYGLSRMVSTFDFAHSKKEGVISYVECDNFKLPWNFAYKKQVWAEKKESINEVGSIYTVQGFDLNYVGVILGPSVRLNNKAKELYIQTDKYKDKGAYEGSLKLENSEQVREQIVLNSINVLLKRGIKGTYIYAYDKELRYYLMTIQS